VVEPYSQLPKVVFVAWCGEGVPERMKGVFNSHVTSISKFFKVCERSEHTRFTGLHVSLGFSRSDQRSNAGGCQAISGNEKGFGQLWC
jgi:hypothetical protein